MSLNVTFIPGPASATEGLPVVTLDEDNVGEMVDVAAGNNSTAAAVTKRGVFRLTAVADVNITIGPTGATKPTGTTGTRIPAGVTDYFRAAIGDFVHTYLPT